MPDESVAVALMNELWGAMGSDTLKVALPAPFVVTDFVSSKVLPSPLPEAWHAGLWKNCSVKVASGLLLSVPVTNVLAPESVTALSTG